MKADSSIGHHELPPENNHCNLGGAVCVTHIVRSDTACYRPERNCRRFYGSLYGTGVALFEVKPNMKLQRVGDTVTANDGKYYFNNVHPGQYVLRVRGVDYTLEVRETQIQDIPVLAPNHVWRNQAGGASSPR